VSRSRDDGDVTRPYDDRTADALLGGRAVEGEPELTAFVADLTALAEAVPTPSAALAELLEHGVVGVAPPVPAAPAVRRRWAPPVWARAVTAGALAFAAVLSAAAANALPGRAQDAVADVVGWVTPVQLPHADDDGVPAPVPSPSVTTSPASQQAPGTTSRTPEPGDDKGDAGGGSSDDGTTGGSDGVEGPDDSGSGSDDGTTGDSGDGSGGDSGDGTTGGSVPGGSDDHSSSPTPDPDDTPTPSPSPDGGGDGSDGH